MEWDREQVKGLLWVVCGGIAFYVLLQHLGTVVAAAGWLLGILSPFLLGGVIACVLNVPMRAIERGLFAGRRSAACRPLALVLAVLSVLAVLGLASGVIGPGVVDAVRSVAVQIPVALRRLEEQLVVLEQWLPQVEDLLLALDLDWTAIPGRLLELAQDWGSGLLSSGGGLIGNVVSGVSTFVIGLIFALYILLQKEKLARQGRQVVYGLLPQKQADHLLEVLRLTERTFSSFLSGQCLEAVILGTLFVIAMTIFRMPYALLVGVLIALTALIPIVGAFIGCAVGALLIAVTDPWKALMFVVLFLVLQQIEGNLIYPHVVGSSVGLPSIWVLAAVTLGGKLMGVAGMLLFIPLCSVLYALFRGYVKERLRQKAVPEERWQTVPPRKKS